MKPAFFAAEGLDEMLKIMNSNPKKNNEEFLIEDVEQLTEESARSVQSSLN